MGGRNDRRPPVRGRSLTRCVLALLTFVLLNFSVAGAQVLQVGGGSSTLFQASGGSIGIRAANYEGVLGAGILDGSGTWVRYFDGNGEKPLSLSETM